MKYKIDEQTAEQTLELYEDHFEVEPDEFIRAEIKKIIMRGRLDIDGDTLIYELKNPIELENGQGPIKQLKLKELSGNEMERIASTKDSEITTVLKYLGEINGYPHSVIGRAKKSDLEALSALMNFF